MNNPYPNTDQHIAQLKSIEQKISQNQLPEAAQQLNLLAKTNPHDPRLFLLGSRLAAAADNPEGILAAARQAHQLAPQWPIAIMHLADVLASRGEAEEAMSLAEQALQLTAAQANQAARQADWLAQAAAVAQRLGHFAMALQWLRQAENINPDDPIIRYKIGLTLTQSGEPVSAIAIFTDLLLQQPNKPALLSARMHACLSARQAAQAIQDGEALLALEPTNAEHRFYLDIARGLTPETLPVSVITSLFGGNAVGVEHPIDVGLRQKLSREVALLVNQWHPDRKVDVLDLGCGAGLLGASLGRTEGVLVGVDLSAHMIGQAFRHQVYDRFHKVNLLDALPATPENLYHVITALDVLTYIGKLDSVIQNAYRILLPEGHFVFSCELGAESEADYTLQSTHRYLHRLSYLQRLLQKAGFEHAAFEHRVLRHEAGQPVEGVLVVARKSPLKVIQGGSRRKQRAIL